MPDFTAEVIQVTSDGRPAEVVFEFHVPLEDETLRWVYFVGGRMEQVCRGRPLLVCRLSHPYVNIRI